MSESYKQSRISYKSYGSDSETRKFLDERFPFKSYSLRDFSCLTNWFETALEEHYDSLCDKDERTDFWRHWCVEDEGKLLLPDFDISKGEYLLRAYLEFCEQHVFTHYQVPDVFKKLMLEEIALEFGNHGEESQWLNELERRWGDYQEELGYRKPCALCPKRLDDKYGHNPYPLGERHDDRCCSDCNTEKVLPARLAEMAR